MKKWIERIGRAASMGLIWAAGWVPVGMVGGSLHVGELEPEHIGGPLYAGFLCGAVFSAVAGIVTGRRRLDELSVSRAGAWGALSGALVGALPFILGSQSAGERGDRPLWVLPVAVIGSLALISAVSAIASALLARMAKKGNWLDAGPSNTPRQERNQPQ